MATLLPVEAVAAIDKLRREDGIVYPGHPLMLASIIMIAFDSYEDAARPTEHGWAEALSDQRIPGAGDHVGAAVRTLGVGAAGGSIDDMVRHANDYWTRGKAGGHEKAVDAGVALSSKIEPHFRAIAKVWAQRQNSASVKDGSL